MHPDKAYKNFLEIYEKYHNSNLNFNESDTRSKIIDFILRDCLDWDENFIVRENSTPAGFSDYELHINNIPVIVIEAKKEGEYFEIPANKKSRNYKISGAISTVDNLMVALNQVHNYAVEIGCKYAAVFNGYQLVLFSAISIGKPWRDGFCLVYNSLEDIKNNFNQFWNILAFQNVSNGSLISFIEKGKSKHTFKKLISEVHNQDQSWARNELYIFIQPYCDFVFSELLDEARTEVLKECYVYDRSSKPLTREIEHFFIDQLPHFADDFNIQQILEEKSRLCSR